MLKEIRAQLLTGSIKNVAIAGSSKLPPTPYVVVKPTNDILGRGTAYEIFVHYPPDYQLDLIEYVKSELPSLLDGFTVYNGDSKKELELLYDETDRDIYPDSDGTIRLSRRFLSANKNGY